MVDLEPHRTTRHVSTELRTEPSVMCELHSGRAGVRCRTQAFGYRPDRTGVAER